ncbi:MAG: TlpA disulfide reductase family protein [Flavobacteriaceae bacterium]|nr:TlpA disulfide reductase family protein [Flavobacteriaceae bacterium]
MRRFCFYLLFLFMIAISCGKSQSYRLNVTTDFEDGKSVYLIELNQYRQPITIDTTIIKNGKFQFEQKIPYPQNSFIEIEDHPQPFLFIAENGSITMEIKRETLPDYALGGTLSNDGLHTYKKDTEAFRSSLEAIGNEGYQAQSQGDSILVEDLSQQYYSVEDQIIQYDIDFVKKNPSSFLSLLIIQSHIPTQTIPNDSLIDLYNHLSDEIKSGSTSKFVSEALGLSKKELKIGDTAPNFSAPRPNGEIASLDQMKSRVTLLDFWASWCKPCRIHSPELVKLYHKFASQGFNIISLSLDERRDDWLQAIEDDGLGSWDHISNLKPIDDPIAETYGVPGIPYYIVLDSIGKIQTIEHDFRLIKKEIENLMEFHNQSD